MNEEIQPEPVSRLTVRMTMQDEVTGDQKTIWLTLAESERLWAYINDHNNGLFVNP